MNRKALEDGAGKDAAKLSMSSTPAGAQLFINEKFVGHTPLALTLAPGKYKIEMRGEQQAYGQRTVSLVPNDSQEVALTLVPLYPSHVSIK